jgi:hypothetical protein
MNPNPQLDAETAAQMARLCADAEDRLEGTEEATGSHRGPTTRSLGQKLQWNPEMNSDNVLV